MQVNESSTNGDLDKIIGSGAGFGFQRQHSVEYFAAALQAAQAKSMAAGEGFFLVKATPVGLGQED